MASPTSVRLTEGLSLELEGHIEKNGGNPSQVIRQSLRAFFDSAPVPHQLDLLNENLENMRRDLAKVGGNLNQTAHYFNIHNDLSRDDLAVHHQELRREFRRLADLFKEIKNVTGR